MQPRLPVFLEQKPQPKLPEYYMLRLNPGGQHTTTHSRTVVGCCARKSVASAHLLDLA